ncbi:ABC transporter ATP-binding protein [Nemorincola caseinilytica]|uniref:ABC transporter ATP-binding protein n=1 Tax=Nemorincola caseinilytica TaxID=2054315 RepID=A0ABP8NQ18_9BACT
MDISLHQVGKRFQRHRVFKDITYTFTSPGAYALLGPNGSGKSTLLRVIAGMQQPSAGKVTHTDSNGKVVEASGVFHSISFCAPGQEIVEEFTLREFLGFHFSFKPLIKGLSIEQVIDIMGLTAAADKPIYDYSSGMKQRVKLAQAIFADTPVLMLDEPCTNLDERGVGQYRQWMDTYAAGRLVLIASNDPREYYCCTHHLRVEDHL